jgi:hypothetical protein
MYDELTTLQLWIAINRLVLHAINHIRQQQ